ncbi:radical SAM protein [Maritimibacter sp. 55A14]|uniref:PA0069 family radical SAM protein n=1 Tax=Maritimibacter sp. 55A14 TaxID=2174844 RepID=UPI000D614A94|nr:PA0069 family radical SAM protein [Maritimibacter sp. 55A14]PWE34262.1 radical SAM protein [Maritimibacter sp. 55A14]
MLPRRPIAPAERPGRGATTNRSGRYEQLTHERADDGWELPWEAPPIRTEIREERARSILTRNTSPDVPFDRSVNPYRGCEHGCIYCFARPSHAWLGLSPGLDFETRLIARPDAPELLDRTLRKPGYRPRPIAISTNTDPYQPAERDRGIMRALLEVLRDHNHPVTVATKGTLIERDADILGEMGRKGLAQAGISVTTLDPGLARRLEPRVPAPARRLAAIAALAEAGCPVRVMVSPVIPALTDHEAERILEAARDAGAQAASWIMLRLPLEVAPLFREWLAEHAPGRAARVMARVREMHGGRDYAADWHRRMRGDGPYAAIVAQRIRVAMARLGLKAELPPLDLAQFAPPPRAGDQLSLF